MKTREQIIAEILLQHKLDRETTDKTDHYKNLSEEQGRAFVDKLLAERDGYSAVIKTDLQKRLTEESYLTCEDFDHFDATCCDTCHAFYPHYEMSVVLLSDDRHAWVCHCIKAILMRETKSVPSSPEEEEKFKLLDEIFGGPVADPVGDELHEASLAAKSDEEKLYYCLKYAHHTYKRKRGHETVEALVTVALGLPGRGPAKSSKTP
jgi:hypothetical protein